ncbi:MAG TPA: ATP-binding protein [Candidatus Udaeobacter sp.]|jgi:two-component system phosphate regulon sensor histidine kinase PhoR
MYWLILGVLCALFAVTALFLWKKWVAPWAQIRQLVSQIARGEPPPTFLVNGGTDAHRIGLTLETIFARQQELEGQIAGRESGTQTILGAMQDGLLVVDARSHVTLMNPTFEKLFGLRDPVVGVPLVEAVRHATLDQLIAETLRTGEATRSQISLVDSQTHVERHIEVSAEPIKKSDDETTGAVILFHDITELKQLDQIRREFVANVSHELRTPLSILRGYIEVLLDNPTSPEESARILSIMERHSKRLGLLIDDLLSLARLESSNANLELGIVHVEELFNNIAHDWRERSAAKKLKVFLDLPPETLALRADEVRLHEVLYNLVENAVKYSHENGQIHLRATKRGDEVVLSVTDNGFGISKEDLPRIFERFYRADKARSRELGGTGLGLAIVKHIAQLHGGRVEAESELGRGTTIRIVLPHISPN